MAPTRIAPATAGAVLGLFAVLLVAVPLWDLWRGAVPRPVVESQQEGRLAAVIAAMERFEDRLETDSEVASQLRRPAHRLRSLLAGGNSQVAVGRGGWLFLRPGTMSLLQPAADASPQRAVIAFRDLLAERGIDLLVLPVPTKASLAPQHLAPRLAPPAQPFVGPAEGAWRDALEAAGVSVYDPAPELLARFGAAAFLKQDSHWSPAAVEVAAQRLAERIVPLLPPAAGLARGLRRESVEVRGRGDLRASLDPAGEEDQEGSEAVVLRPVVTAEGEPWKPTSGAPVLLLGDSFSNVFSDERLGWGRGAGLAEQLAFALGRPVDRIALDAGGANGARQRLRARSRSGEDLPATTHVVVWQVAAREIAAGGWEVMTDFEAPASAASFGSRAP